MIQLFALVLGLVVGVLVTFLQAFVIHTINYWYIPQHMFTFAQWLGIVWIYDALSAKVPNPNDQKNLTLEEKIGMVVTYPLVYLLILLLAWICR